MSLIIIIIILIIIVEYNDNKSNRNGDNNITNENKSNVYSDENENDNNNCYDRNCFSVILSVTWLTRAGSNRPILYVNTCMILAHEITGCFETKNCLVQTYHANKTIIVMRMTVTCIIGSTCPPTFYSKTITRCAKRC